MIQTDVLLPRLLDQRVVKPARDAQQKSSTQFLFLRVSLDFGKYVELMLHLASDFILSDVLGNAELPAWIPAIEELARRNPKPVYTFLAEELREGQEVVEPQKKANVKKRLGFKVTEEYRR